MAFLLLCIVSTTFLIENMLVSGHPTTDSTIKNVTAKVGICEIEVPVAQILNITDTKIILPRGNGTKEGYSRIEVCCKGYKRHPQIFRRCEPQCLGDCVNGKCVAPNTCVCPSGFVKDLGGNCQPTCPTGCLNGVCIKGKNYECSCNLGFMPDHTGHICVPICSKGCGNGNCTAPETCVCSEGFVPNKNGQCDFYCEGGCEGKGECIGPNKCACKEGYILKNGICEPLCPSGCPNGICAQPNVCTCLPGYTLDKSGTKCIPHCDQTCLNGDCVGPNQCVCKKGYIQDPYTYYKCVAHCPDGCVNGVCSGPNFCICNPGFIKPPGAPQSNTCIPTKSKRSIIRYDLIPRSMYLHK